MSKYGIAIGVWDLKVGRTEQMGALQLHPTHRDNRELLSFIMDEKVKNNPNVLLDKIGLFLEKIISKDYPPVNDAEKEELVAYINSNIMELMDETLITFKLLKREDIVAQKELLKKGILQVGK